MLRWFLALPAHRKVLLFLAGGMLTLVFDALIAHMSWSRMTMTWNQWIPVVYGMLASVALGALAVIQLGRRSENRLLLWTGALGLVVGLLGVWFHLVGFMEGIETEETITLVVVGKTLATAPPIFAPAAYAGVGLLLVVLKRLTGAHRAEQEAEQASPARRVAAG